MSNLRFVKFNLRENLSPQQKEFPILAEILFCEDPFLWIPNLTFHEDKILQFWIFFFAFLLYLKLIRDGHNLRGTRAGTFDREAKISFSKKELGWEKKGVQTYFRKELRGRRIFWLKSWKKIKRGLRVFFGKVRRHEDFFQ